MAESEWLSFGDAEQIYDYSPRELHRMRKKGQIRCDRKGERGHWRVWRPSLDRILRPQIAAPISVSNALQNRLESVKSKELEIRETHIDRELRKLRAEDAEAEQQREEARRAQAFTEKQAADEGRDRRRRERQERERAQALDMAQRERNTWESEITSAVLAQLPHDVPADVKMSASESVRQALGSASPDHSQQLIAISVGGAISRALAPWRRRKEIERAIDEAESTLPWDMRGLARTTEWQLRFRAAAEAEISVLPDEAPLSQIRAVARSEAARLTAEFERGQAEEQHRRRCVELLEGLRWRVLARDCGAAREVLQKAFGQLPVGSSAKVLEETADRALVPFEHRREVAQRAERFLNHVGAYIEKLGAPGGEWELGDYFDRCKLAQKLTKKIRSDLIEAMLAGEVEDDQDAKDFIEDEIELELEEEE